MGFIRQSEKHTYTKMKVIFLTFSATLAVIISAAILFLKPILGVFGWEAMPVETFQNLQASSEVVKQMKKQQKQKKLKTTKRFAKKSAKRVTSVALAAATIGSVAVAVTMTIFEIVDYCEEKKRFQEDNNILYETQIEFDYEQCIEEGKEDSKTMLSQLKNSSATAVSSTFNGTAEYGAKKWRATKEASMHALQSTDEAVSSLWDSAESWYVER